MAGNVIRCGLCGERIPDAGLPFILPGQPPFWHGALPLCRSCHERHLQLRREEHNSRRRDARAKTRASRPQESCGHCGSLFTPARWTPLPPFRPVAGSPRTGPPGPVRRGWRTAHVRQRAYAGAYIGEQKVPICRGLRFLPGASGGTSWKSRKPCGYAGWRMNKVIAARPDGCTGMTGKASFAQLVLPPVLPPGASACCGELSRQRESSRLGVRRR